MTRVRTRSTGTPGTLLEVIDAQRVRVHWDDGLTSVIRKETLIVEPPPTTVHRARMTEMQAMQNRLTGTQVERDAALAEVDRLAGIIAEACVHVDASRKIVDEHLMTPDAASALDLLTRLLKPILATAGVR